MGLDTSHDCWHGGYISFNVWREKLAEAAGLPPLQLMSGHYGGELKNCASGPFKSYIEQVQHNLPIKWEALKPDVLYVLLDHSDCDGEIPADVCDSLADRLEELLPAMTGDWYGRTRQFIDGLRLAASENNPVEFG